MRKSFEDQLKGLPAKSGVYLFRDERGNVLYVGKAKSLRQRVRSYFQASQESRTTIRQLPDRIDDIEVIVTGTEVEALHLEQNLVKRHRPPFNVRLPGCETTTKTCIRLAVAAKTAFRRWARSCPGGSTWSGSHA